MKCWEKKSININKIRELKGEWIEVHKLNYAGRYMFIGAGNGYLTGYGDDNFDIRDLIALSCPTTSSNSSGLKKLIIFLLVTLLKRLIDSTSSPNNSIRTGGVP